MNQRTSVKPVSEGLARQIGRMVEDASRNYPGGTAKLELVKGHRDFKERLYWWLDEMAVEAEAIVPLRKRPPFMTIQIGTFKDVLVMRQALKDGKYNVSDWANDLMDRMTLVTEPTTLDLYRATNAELSLSKGGTVAQSFEAIAKFGGEKLPAEAGPQYRLQNPDQKLGQWELMYMDPITGRNYCPGVFYAVRGRDGLSLRGTFARSAYFYGADYVWLFGRPRKRR